MKTINNYLTESVMKYYFLPEYDIKPYVDIMLKKWLETVNAMPISSLDDKYQKIVLCRRCAELVYILDKFSNNITIHFMHSDKEETKFNKKHYADTFGDRLVNAFNVIEAIIKTGDEPKDLQDDESVLDTIKQLRTDFDDLVKKYNEKYHEKVEKGKIAASGPCDCACDCECCCNCECADKIGTTY